MPRGRLLKTKIKEAVTEASLVAESIKLAEARAERKLHLTKPYMDSLREHIGKWIDRINIDPLELVAILGTTILIKNGIEWTEQSMGNQDLLRTFSKVLVLFNPILGLSWAVGMKPISELIGSPEFQEKLDSPEVETMQWFLSFTVAYIIVRHFPAIVQTAGSVVNMAKGLLGMIPV